MPADVGEDESALIYGLEAPSRTLTAGPTGSAAASESSLVRFVVGTQVLRSAGENVVHVLEYVEESHSLSKAVFRHATGEIWSLSCCPNPETPLLASSYSTLSDGNHIRNSVSIWRFPVDLNTSLVDEESTVTDLLKVSDVDAGRENGDNSSCSNSGTERILIWKPDDEGNELLTLANDKIHIYDLKQEKVKRSIPALPQKSAASRLLSKVSSVKWSPHSNASILGVAVGANVMGMDMRISESSSQPIWTIAAHNHFVRDADFNPNAQYVMATVGDDCETRIWDVRKPSAPVVSLLSHSHWIWSIRFNQFHDQLLLSCSSDSKVLLTRIASQASQPFGHLIQDSSDEEVMMQRQRGRSNADECLSDKVIAEFEEHEDSVYCAEWSTADPWTFASLSYDGRLVINKVPKSEKMNILF